MYNVSMYKGIDYNLSMLRYRLQLKYVNGYLLQLKYVKVIDNNLSMLMVSITT